MANYVISDIHGHYDQYLKMLEKIHFSNADMLYVLGDVVDRGPHPIQILQDLMRRPNVVCIAGNHEVMFCECIKALLIEQNPRKGFIYQSHNNIVIDCGCGQPGGRLACLRLDDMEEFYVE